VVAHRGGGMPRVCSVKIIKNFCLQTFIDLKQSCCSIGGSGGGLYLDLP
jgi:hypothetical protein